MSKSIIQQEAESAFDFHTASARGLTDSWLDHQRRVLAERLADRQADSSGSMAVSVDDLMMMAAVVVVQKERELLTDTQRAMLEGGQ